jgi:hypothetical protein
MPHNFFGVIEMAETLKRTSAKLVIDGKEFWRGSGAALGYRRGAAAVRPLIN